jgi:hypothetical protein
MSAEDDLRLAWLAHREGRAGRRDALLTLAAATAEGQGVGWVGAVRDFLVAAHPGHLFAGFYHLDEALADRRVVAALGRLRQSFPPARVRALLRRAEVARGPYTGRSISVAIALDELLAPSRAKPRGAAKLGATKVAAAPKRSAPPPVPVAEPAEPVLAFYLNVLLSVAVLCALVVGESRDDKRAA